MQNSQENKKMPLIPFMLLGVLIINSAVLSYKYINFYYFRDLLADINSLACTTDCDAVMLSKFAIILGVPTPVYGLLAFIALTYLFARLYFSDSNNKKIEQNFELLLITCVTFAAVFIYIMYFKLELVCKFCMLSHITTFIFAAYYFIYYKTRYIEND